VYLVWAVILKTAREESKRALKKRSGSTTESAGLKLLLYIGSCGVKDVSHIIGSYFK
jgi:hypothetical protein